MPVHCSDNARTVTCGCGRQARVRFYPQIISRDRTANGRWMCDNDRWRYDEQRGWNCGQSGHSERRPAQDKA